MMPNTASSNHTIKPFSCQNSCRSDRGIRRGDEGVAFLGSEAGVLFVTDVLLESYQELYDYSDDFAMICGGLAM
ncbi:MAG: hypothetical protein NW214_12730 [Pseudanabaenaceae cyanobacterium bins.39]|nr:hypothetical protein [Pseudanabaenaceae cyanobacterium bins.39]